MKCSKLIGPCRIRTGIAISVECVDGIKINFDCSVELGKNASEHVDMSNEFGMRDWVVGFKGVPTSDRLEPVLKM